MFSRLKFSAKFWSDGFWSLLGNTISVVAGFLAVKIITRFVAADVYGEASLALGIVALLNNFLIGPLMTAQNRIYFDYVEKKMALWFAATFERLLAGASVLAVCIYFLIAGGYFLKGEPLYLGLIFPTALLIFLQPQMSARTLYLEAHREQKKLAAVNILQKIFYPAALFMLLMVPLSRSSSIVWAQALAVIPLLLFYRPSKALFLSNIKPADHLKEWQGLKQLILSFGWVLPMGSLAHWVLSTSDRYLIQHFMTLRDVGVYAMNYGFWSMPYLLLNGWLEILTRPLLYDKAAKAQWMGVKRIIFYRTACGVLLSLLGTIALFFFGELIASKMLGPSYWVDRKLMMTIAGAHCFFVIGYSLVSLFLAMRKPKAIFIATSIAAALNLVINIFVIPVYGVQGAASATFISYFIWAGVLAVMAYFLIRSTLLLKEPAGDGMIK